MAQAPPRSLYDRDFLAWCEDTAARLRDRDISHLDWDNLIEEIESLGRAEVNAYAGALTALLEHLLKRCYCPYPHDFHGWERAIRQIRRDLEVMLRRTPSLKAKHSSLLADAWELALKWVREDYPTVTFPEGCPFPADPEALLARRFWEPQD